MSVKIVTRHAGAVAWLKTKMSVGISGEVIAQLDPTTVELGDVIYGVLPVELTATLLAKGAEVYILSLPAIAFGQRGAELSPAEMDTAGAKLLRVRNITLEEVR